MLISCPNCKTSFAVPAKAIGAAGRNLKCSKCTHTWFQEPLNFNKDKLNELLSVEVPNPENDNKLPKKIKNKNAHVGLLVLLCLTVLAFYLQKLKNPEFSRLADYQNISFSQVTSKSELSDNKYKITVNATISNSSSVIVKIPPLNIKIFAKNGVLLKEQEYIIGKESLSPKSSHDFEVILDNVSATTDKVVINTKHWLEKLFL